jgi:aspartyl-tRNA(Asn)/glutamyl-tRNA(Gln) amidotransferase subunit A
MLSGCDPDVRRALDAAVGMLSDRGIGIEEVSLALFDELNWAAAVLTASEAVSIHAARLSDHPEWYSPIVRGRLLLGLLYGAADYVDALRLRGVCLRDALLLVSRVDALLCPVVGRAGPRLSDAEAADDAIVGALAFEFLRYNRPINYLGLPAVTFPAGMSEAGDPVGLQLVGAPYTDFGLLELARSLAAPEPGA